MLWKAACVVKATDAPHSAEQSVHRPLAKCIRPGLTSAESACRAITPANWRVQNLACRLPRAFSSEVDTGSREEKRVKTKS
jgi:hypothetical protein